MSQTSTPGATGSSHTGLLFTLTIIAALGGLLFGYDTAVISGATDSIKQNFVAPMNLTEGARLSLEGFTIAGALWGCLIGGAIGYFVVSVEAIRDRSLLRFVRLACYGVLLGILGGAGGVLLGALILGERLTPAMIGGGVLVVGAVVLVVRRSPPAH